MGNTQTTCPCNCNTKQAEEHEYDEANTNNGVITNRDGGLSLRSNLSDDFICTRQLENKTKSKQSLFSLPLEKLENVKYPPVSNRSNNSQVHLSEVKDEVISDQLSYVRNGKSFISLLREFSFIQKLHTKGIQIKSSQTKENLASPSEVSSVNSNYSKNFLSSYQDGEDKSLKYKLFTSKEIFQKVKNLLYIPIISTKGQVANTFYVSKENDNLLKVNRFTIQVPYFVYFQEFLQTFLNSINPTYDSTYLSKIINKEKIKFTISFIPDDLNLNYIDLTLLLNSKESLELPNCLREFCEMHSKDVTVSDVCVSYFTKNEAELEYSIELKPKIFGNNILNLMKDMMSFLNLNQEYEEFIHSARSSQIYLINILSFSIRFKAKDNTEIEIIGCELKKKIPGNNFYSLNYKNITTHCQIIKYTLAKKEIELLYENDIN